MKMRSGFVSNSSSSSFIIATEPGEGPPAITVTMSLESVLTETFKTKEELDKHIFQDYGWGDNPTIESILESEDYIKDWYNASVKALEEGKVVYWGSGSNEDYDAVSQFIYAGGLTQKSLGDAAQLISDEC